MTERTSPKQRRTLVAFLSVLALAALSAGFFWLGRTTATKLVSEEAQEMNVDTTYFCAMHPHIRQDRLGKCSICGMELIPAESNADLGERVIEISEVALRLAEIETARVERRTVHARVRMPGKVDFDESRVKTITAWVPGRLDRLYVDAAGVPIKRGDHLVDIFSPRLLVAQQQLIEALRSVSELSEMTSDLVREATHGTLAASRDNLRLSGLTPDQISAIEQRGTASDHIVVNAPMGGIVVAKVANEGDYVETGKPIYRIADLSRVWVLLDAFESDLTWLRFGQAVEFSTQAFPGEVFKGTIHFIDWVVGARTRTVKVRVAVANLDHRLKPGMFVRAVVKSTLYGGGLVLAPYLKGKWISPMHPEIVKDAPGECDVCGMQLVPAEELFGPIDTATSPPLVIPAKAPLVTGKRAVVYVKLANRDKPTFEGREVILGPRAGEEYIVLAGLAEGDEVVTRGNFKIDSQLQIDAKPSMMNPQVEPSGVSHRHHGQHDDDTKRVSPSKPERSGNHGHRSHDGVGRDLPHQTGSQAGHEQRLAPATLYATLGALRLSYFKVAESLAGDRPTAGRDAFRALAKLLTAAGEESVSALPEVDRREWQTAIRRLREESEAVTTISDIGRLRAAFGFLSRTILDLEDRFGHTDGSVLYEVYCPMAFDNKGAAWLQATREISNPYFGSAMLRCGRVRKTLPSKTIQASTVKPAEEERP